MNDSLVEIKNRFIGCPRHQLIGIIEGEVLLLSQILINMYTFGGVAVCIQVVIPQDWYWLCTALNTGFTAIV